MNNKNNFQTKKRFSFKLTKVAGIILSSMLIFSAFNISQAQDAGVDTAVPDDRLTPEQKADKKVQAEKAKTEAEKRRIDTAVPDDRLTPEQKAAKKVQAEKAKVQKLEDDKVKLVSLVQNKETARADLQEHKESLETELDAEKRKVTRLVETVQNYQSKEAAEKKAKEDEEKAKQPTYPDTTNIESNSLELERGQSYTQSLLTEPTSGVHLEVIQGGGKIWERYFIGDSNGHEIQLIPKKSVLGDDSILGDGSVNDDVMILGDRVDQLKEKLDTVNRKAEDNKFDERADKVNAAFATFERTLAPQHLDKYQRDAFLLAGRVNSYKKALQNYEDKFEALEKIETATYDKDGNAFSASSVENTNQQIRRSIEADWVAMKKIQTNMRVQKTAIENKLKFIEKMVDLANKKWHESKNLQTEADALIQKSLNDIVKVRAVRQKAKEAKAKAERAYQRSLAILTKVEKIQSSLIKSRTDIEKINTKVHNINADVRGLLDRNKKVKQKTKIAEDLFKNLRRQVKAIEDVAKNRNTQVNEYLQIVRDADKEIKRVKTNLAPGAMPTVVKDQQKEANKLRQDFDNFRDTDFANLKTKYDTFEKQVNKISSQVDTAEEKSGGITQGHGRLQIHNGDARTPAYAKLTVENPQGNIHGLEVTGTETKLTGGTRSSSLTLNDEGATFSDINARGNAGKPIKVTGVADGSSDFDAVNFRQLDEVSKAVAMSMAMDGIPQAFNGKGSIGLGVARFNDNDAFALGAAYHDNEYDILYNVKIAQAASGNQENVATLGVGWKF